MSWSLRSQLLSFTVHEHCKALLDGALSQRRYVMPLGSPIAFSFEGKRT
jgi:hypothetical protein